MRQALVTYLRTYDIRKKKCKHPRSKAKGGVEGGVGRLNAAGEGQHWERTTLQQLCVRSSKAKQRRAHRRFFHAGNFS
jgi:hypothetical protein